MKNLINKCFSLVTLILLMILVLDCSEQPPILVPNKVFIPVSFQSQFVTGNTKNNFCCGLAAVNMGIAYLNGSLPTTDTLEKMYKYLGLNSGCNTGTTPDNQLKVAKEIGNAKNSFSGFLTWNNLKSYLNNRNPIVINFLNSYITNKCNNAKGYHSVLLIGYNESDGYWIVNDPSCNSSDDGMNKRITSSEFIAASEYYAKVSNWGFPKPGYAYVTVLKK